MWNGRYYSGPTAGEKFETFDDSGNLFFFIKSEFVFRGAYKAVQRRSRVVRIVLRRCKVDALNQRKLAMVFGRQ